MPRATSSRSPDDWSFEEGAALPVNYATAYAGLMRYGGLQQGERVLIHAAAGGVGIAATQIAKLHGAEVFGTASASKHDAIRGFGVDHPIDYRTRTSSRRCAASPASKEPLDLVMDAIGGKSFGKSFSLLRPGGRLVCFGASAVITGERRSIPQALKTHGPHAALPPDAADVGVQGGDRAEHAHAVGRPGIARRVRSSPCASGSRRASSGPVVAEAFPLEEGPPPTATSPSARTWARSC